MLASCSTCWHPSRCKLDHPSRVYKGVPVYTFGYSRTACLCSHTRSCLPRLLSAKAWTDTKGSAEKMIRGTTSCSFADTWQQPRALLCCTLALLSWPAVRSPQHLTCTQLDYKQQIQNCTFCTNMRVLYSGSVSSVCNTDLASWQRLYKLMGT